MSEMEYKTQGLFFFGNIKLGHQTADNGWGGFLHRIALLDSDSKTMLNHGRESAYQHPALFDVLGRSFIVMTSYYEDDTSMKPEIIYQLLPPPDSNMALKSVEERALVLMGTARKMDFADILGLDDCAGIRKQTLAERVIRLRDRIEALGESK